MSFLWAKPTFYHSMWIFMGKRAKMDWFVFVYLNRGNVVVKGRKKTKRMGMGSIIAHQIQIFFNIWRPNFSHFILSLSSFIFCAISKISAFQIPSVDLKNKPESGTTKLSLIKFIFFLNLEEATPPKNDLFPRNPFLLAFLHFAHLPIRLLSKASNYAAATAALNSAAFTKIEGSANFGGRIISTTTTQLPIIRPVECNDEIITQEQCSKNCSGYGGQCVVAKEFSCRCNHYYYGCTETYYNYTCQCKPGFTGAGCEICPRGFYGLNCTFQCPTGLWGIGCTNGCNCSMPGSVSPQSCYPANGNCICAPGYLRRRPPTSEGGGKGCACAKEKKTEAIVLPIWEGGEAEDCLYPCPKGKWGKECAQKCDCQNGAKCHHERGQCQCTEGWTGPKCEVQCVKGTAKPGCKFSCDCFAAEHGKCEESTGLCACFAGFMGPRCEWPCPNGFGGAGCHRRCPQNCPQCHPESGRCNAEQNQGAKNVAYILKNASDSADE